MAKKKAPAVAASEKKTEDIQARPESKSCNPSPDKMENLKTLNQFLLKETMERREQLGHLRAQVDCLSDDHDFLSGLERDVARLVLSSRLSELDRTRRDAERLALDLRTVLVEKTDAEGRAELLQSRVSSLSDALGDYESRLGKALEEKLELKKALDVALSERDAGRMDLHLKAREVGSLEARVRELEIGNVEIKDALEKAIEDREWLAEEGNGREEYIQSLLQEKSSVESRLADSEQLVKCTERKMEEVIQRQQDEVEFLKTEGEMKSAMLSALKEEHRCLKEANGRMELELSGSREEIASLKKEKGGLQLVISNMEKMNMEAQEELKKLRVQLGVVEKEKEERELMLQSRITESVQKIDDLIARVREIAREKEQVEQEKSMQEAELFVLQKVETKLRWTVLELQESCRNKDEENNQLQADRDRVQSELDAKGEHARALGLQFDEALKSKDEAEKELGMLKVMLGRLKVEKEDRERQFELLIEEKALLDKSLSAAKSDLEDLGRKVKAAEIYSVRAISLLKSTTEKINRSLEGPESGLEREIGSDVELDEEILPFASELEVIKKAFRSKTQKIESLSLELESLQCAMAEEQKKKKGFRTWLYPATTTVFAVVSFAYAARGR